MQIDHLLLNQVLEVEVYMFIIIWYKGIYMDILSLNIKALDSNSMPNDSNFRPWMVILDYS